MTEEDQVDEMRCAVASLLALAQRTSPQDFQRMFTAAIANTAGVLPEPYWKVMMDCKPCSVEGCTCHEPAQALMNGADVIRADHIKTMTTRTKGN